MPILRKRFSTVFCSVVFLMLVLLISAGCNKTKKTVSVPPAPVTVAVAGKKTVPVELKLIGNVEPYSTVDIRAANNNIEGLVKEVCFTEGQDVSKGSLLFKMDQEPYLATVKQLQGVLRKDTASLKNARIEEKRYKELFQKDYVSHEQYDQMRTNAAVLEETVNSDKAALDDANLQLNYCNITAPISGRTGSLAVHAGSMVRNVDTTAMVVINQIQPIYVTFSAPEQQLPEIRQRMKTGFLPVKAFIPGDNAHFASGKLVFIENTVDETTGTIKLKAKFDNKDKMLWPGQFVNVVLTLGKKLMSQWFRRRRYRLQQTVSMFLS